MFFLGIQNVCDLLQTYIYIDLNKESLDKLDEEGLEDHVSSNDYYFEGINLDQNVHLDSENNDRMKITIVRNHPKKEPLMDLRVQ